MWVCLQRLVEVHSYFLGQNLYFLTSLSCSSSVQLIGVLQTLMDSVLVLKKLVYS